MTEHPFDVVIIGSGAGGGACAWALANAGVRVLVLEAGPSFDYLSDYALDREDWETRRFPRKPRSQGRYRIPPLQELESGYASLRSFNAMTGPAEKGPRRRKGAYLHVQGVGGSTLHFLGEAHRLHPDSMKLRSRHGVGADWPIDYNELEPFYARAEWMLGVAGPSAKNPRWRSRPYPLPAHDLGYATRRLAPAFKRNGLTLEQNPLAILSKPRFGYPDCNYCANCVRGCPRGDKGSIDLRCIAPAVSTGRCTVRPHSRVIRIEPGSGDRIDSVIYADAQGKRHRVKARTVVVSCGAVQTPRLLLHSSGPRSPRGLANESGQVGRNFMETLFAVATGLHPERLGSHRGVPVDGIAWDYSAPDAIPGVIGGCRFSAGAAQADLVGPIGYATRLVDGWGPAHKAKMRDAFGRAVSVLAVGDWLPNARSFVDLDPQQKDELGVPLARFHSHLGQPELKRLAFMAKKARDVLKESGVSEILEQYTAFDMVSASHVFGACRMGRDPETSVVNADCRSHRWSNLFVVDASVFPSAGGGEAPSLTIAAIALRAAAHIASLLRRGDI